MDEGSGLGLRTETGEEGGIVKYLAGELVATRMKPGMLVLLYLVSWELGNLFRLLSGVISPVKIGLHFILFTLSKCAVPSYLMFISQFLGSEIIR